MQIFYGNAVIIKLTALPESGGIILKTHCAEKYIFKNQFFGIGKAEYSNPVSFLAHKHKFIELVYIVSGKSTHYVDDCIYELRHGDLLFIGYNQIHSFSAVNNFSLINIYIKPEYVSKLLSGTETIHNVLSYFASECQFTDDEIKLPFISLGIEERIEFENIAAKCISEAEAKSVGYEFALNGYIQLIFFCIIRSLKKNETKCISDSITTQIIEYVNKNYYKSLTLADIANAFFYTPSHLSKAFKKTFGMSLKDYIYEKRVQQAEKLLVETDESIESISLAVGYVNKNQFYKLFKEKKGCTPKQFRDKNKF